MDTGEYGVDWREYRMQADAETIAAQATKIDRLEAAYKKAVEMAAMFAGDAEAQQNMRSADLTEMARLQSENKRLREDMARATVRTVADGALCMDLLETLELIAAPKRPDGSWNRDRESCRQLAEQKLKSWLKHST